MSKSHLVAVVAGLLLAVSGPSFAANRMFHTKSAVKWHPRAVHSNGSAASGSAVYPYGRGPNLYNRSDPYAPGVNWPGNGAL